MIGALLSFVLGGGKGTKISMFILVAVLAIAGTVIGLKLMEIYSLKSIVAELTKKNNELTVDNTILIANNKVLKDNLKVVTDTSQTNYETAKKLDAERAQSKAAIASLAASNQRTEQTLKDLNEKITTMAKDPKNDGPVSPVLRETIRQIQGGTK